MVERRPFYAHKVIVSQLSEKFRAMFRSNMIESQSNKSVTIENLSY